MFVLLCDSFLATALLNPAMATCKATFDYAAENGDELSFDVGDIITIKASFFFFFFFFPVVVAVAMGDGWL